MVVSVISGISCGKAKNGAQEKQYVRNPVKVEVQPVKRGDLVKTLNYKGTVFPWRRANIGPDISGRIHKIYKKQGDRVKKGRLLAELDTTTIDLQLKQARAALDVANAALEDAELNFQRLDTLYKKTAISKLQLEKARLNLESARTQKKSAAATVDVIKHNLDTSYMRAPFDGIITAKTREEGDFINPMMGMGAPVLTLMDLSRVKVKIDVPSEEIESIAVEQPCAVRVATLKEKTFNGTVYSKNMAADPMSKTFKVEVEIDNPGLTIKTGVFAEVEVRVLKRPNLLLIPVSALMTGPDASYVVLYQEGLSRFRNVKAGERNQDVVEILEGLEVGELVVVSGNYDLQDRAPITK
jgi:RND family efflux transporter MFP subunit